ncbi:MAG: hypothetical protein ABI881_17510 [Betaproteobacteria bacterium]
MRSTRKFEQRRTERRFASDSDGQQRTVIAQAAARLIAEHGITDWSMAKRKAIRELDLGWGVALPGDDEVEVALADYHALYSGEEHDVMIRAQREEALTWMRKFAAFSPRLTGGVAAGWATEDSGIRLELDADNAKSVELALINAGLRYRPLSSYADGPIELAVETPAGGLHLVVRTLDSARHRPRRERGAREELRLTVKDVEALLTDSRAAEVSGASANDAGFPLARE